ncbi:hypothetical protein BDY19DRAFT_765250 [Irpex rosettiformis]|uniref:Uncharacterized protein n=1 Tax=Irpex rosettiformis TaxID=378272 RepID=A0ACB8U7F5_9APHY|nr:hypothetical protein BDY19DRAFT_765250 [Irpex rosettiformis]
MAFKYAFMTAAVLLAFAGAIADAAECTTTTDLENLKAKVAPGQNLRIGPGGLYADTSDNECFFLSINQPDLKENFPTLVEDYHSVMKNLTDPEVTPMKAALDPLVTPGCGQPCSPSQGCLYPCACRFQYEFCDPYGCFDTYKCTG